MDYALRPITEDDFDAYHRLLGTTFGEDSTEESIEYERRFFEYDRSLVAIDGGDMVGSAGAYSFDLTLPGATTVPAAGVTWVGVLPTHRRRGILRTMMGRQLDDVAERGEPVAVLLASEAVIYGRFGYGVATRYASVDVPTRGTEDLAPPAAGGRIRLLDTEAARKVLPGVFDRYRRSRPGSLTRNERHWESYLSDPKDWRDGGSARYYAVHETGDGEADGYVAYRVKETWNDLRPLPGNTVVGVSIHTADPEVEAALFRFVLDIDLVGSVQFPQRPLDDPLRWRLVDPRRYLTTKVRDWMWVRLVDIPAALSARRYQSGGALVLEVRDRFRPANDGFYRLEVGAGGAQCRRLHGTGHDADVSLAVDMLGAAYLGGVAFSTLAAAGRVSGAPGALARADAMFASTPLPFCDLAF